jgi:gamma-glutamyltranspeptidase/glutathione hydrolase
MVSTASRMRASIVAATFVAAALFAPSLDAAGRKPVGAVVSSEADATQAGLEVLEAGGNAVDAAVATALALAVVHPQAGNLGGGGFAVVRVDGTVATLDFRETAPAAATADMYLDERGDPRPDATLVGPLAAGVPGSPAGYFELHRRFGRLPWRRVVAPAIRLARDGFEVSARTAHALAEDRDRLALFPETAAEWLPGGTPRGWGERLRLPALAATLESYAEKGPEAITEGRLADAIIAASRRHGGVLDAADLAGYRAVWRPPLRFSRFGWEIAAMGLPTSGGTIVGEVLGLLERLGWSSLPRGDIARAHLLVEAFRRAYADRFPLGDPASTEATPAQLLAPAWLDRRAAGIARDRATPSREVRPFPEAPTARESNQTTHVSVVDGDGNLVALTTTLNDDFGCRLWVPETGFFLNDEMDDFATAPGRPNTYGLIQGRANAVAPGRRMLSSMAPLLTWRGGDELAIGGRGGSRIPTAIVQVLLALWDGDGARAAVARPRLHEQWLPDELTYEEGALTADQIDALARLGHHLVPATSDAKVNLVVRHADGTVDAAGDPRGPAVSGTTR